jgi:hypothetical protein
MIGPPCEPSTHSVKEQKGHLEVKEIEKPHWSGQGANVGGICVCWYARRYS